MSWGERFLIEGGHLWVLVNGTWIDLGEVVGGPGQPGAPGQSITIVEQYINDEGNTVIVFSDGTEVIVNKGICETCGLGSSVGGSSELITGSSALLAGSSLLGSSVDDDDDNGTATGSSDARCVQAATTVGIPLLALLPIGLATQVNIPGLSPMVANAQAQLQSFNTDIQQQSGIYDPNTSNFMAQVNAELQKHGATVGQAVGAAALIAIGGLVGKYLYDSCVPRG